MTRSLWVNGALVDPDTPVVRADDHGLVVGDGVFETLEVRDGAPFAYTRHLRRLRESAAGLGMSVDEAAVRAGVDAVLADRPDHARLRITVTGGPSPYGSDRGDAPPTVLIATGALPQWPETADIALVPWTRNENAATVGLKTTSYADNVVALRYAHDHDAAEALFVNSRGEICEGTGSNIFYVADDVLITPPLATGCLGGITRELLLEWLRADGTEVFEAPQRLGSLNNASEAFLTSSTRRVQAIRALDGRPFPAAPGPMTRHAAALFDACAQRDLDP